MSSWKSQIYTHCMYRVEQMIKTAEESLSRAQQAANSETKSSVGDKFETGRAMAHAEIHKSQRQLGEARVLLMQLKQIDILQIKNSIEIGSLISTNRGTFFLSIGLGKIRIDDQAVFVLGVQSPIGKLLFNKTLHDSFEFNGNTFIIKAIS